ncbi:hypothetical protein [Streptomyces luteireticuli]|uniref:hypothetical protein n=1 Tax=Streptomyces luteireticuli TaxID=173858 RepID=UPI003558AC48
MQQLVIDTWGALSFKPAFREGARALPGAVSATWVPETDRRRLAAYTVLAAYENNQAAALLDREGDDRREYGDPTVIVDQTLAHLLGETQKIVVLDHDDGDDRSGQRPTHRTERLLRDWATAEHLWMRLQHAERSAVLLGDAVYLLAWSRAKNRPVLSSIDAGFYFPVLPDGAIDADQFPDRVHLAWEVAGDPATGRKGVLRRVTYELGPIDPSGTTRIYPWSSTPSSTTCYLTDAEWDLDQVNGGADIDGLSLSRARIRTNADGAVLDRLDLEIDFLPLVHMPNTVAGAEHFGRSSLMSLAQLLDDLGAADTDAQRASATTGSPIIGLSGARLPVDRATGQPAPVRVEPGMVWPLGEQGHLSTVDTSAQLAELRAYVEALRDRLSVASRLPGSVLGTESPSQVPSGYALQLSFGPLDAMVRSMRLAREPKYGLLLKMVLRLYQLGGVLPPGPQPPARVAFGPYLPTDQSSVLTLVVTGVQGGVLSVETAVRMLIDAGMPIEDAAAEVARIRDRNVRPAPAVGVPNWGAPETETSHPRGDSDSPSTADGNRPPTKMTKDGGDIAGAAG